METNPLILTLSLNQEAADYFTQMRDKHFPPERNFLKAHLTLFHKLPNEAAVTDALSDMCRNQAQLPLEVTGPVGIGNGVAFRIISEALQHFHKSLQQKWLPLLSPQDKQTLRPHITIQNKVTPETAKRLEASLKESFSPFTILGTGVEVWEYLGGPWRHITTYTFIPRSQV